MTVFEWLKGKVSEKTQRKFEACDELEKLALMKQTYLTADGLERIALSAVSLDIPLFMGPFTEKDALKLAAQLLQPFKSCDIETTYRFLSRKFPRYESLSEPLCSYTDEEVLEFELDWIKIWKECMEEGRFVNFDRDMYPAFDYGHIKHTWHPKTHFGFPDMIGGRNCPPVTKYVSESNQCVTKIENHDDWIFDDYCSCNSDPGLMFGKHEYFADLKVAVQKWCQQIVVCEKCKLPGCFGFFVCASAPVARVADLSDPVAFGEIYNAVFELAPSHRIAIDKLLLHIPNQRVLDVVVAFGFILSKFFGEKAYELVLKSIKNSQVCKEFSFVLKKSGAVASASGAAMTGLDELAKLCGFVKAEEIKIPSDNLKCSEAKLGTVLDKVLAKELPGIGNKFKSLEEFKDALKTQWRNINIVFALQRVDGLLGLSQRLQLMRADGPFLSLKISKGHSFSNRHREMVSERLFSSPLTAAQSVELDEFVEKILLASYAMCSMSDSDLNFIFYNNSACICTSNPKALVKNLRAIGLEFTECFSDDAILLDDCAFTGKFARGNDIISAFSRLFTVHERFKGYSKKALIEEYASAAWSLVNRTGNKYAAVPFTSQMHEATGLDREHCRKILLGEMSVSFGPSRKAKDGVVDVLLFGLPDFEIDCSLPEVEVEALKYLKSRRAEYKVVSVKVCDAESSSADSGYFSSFKVLSTLKDHLNREELAQVLSIVGCPQSDADEFERAWGRKSLPKVIHGALPYETKLSSSVPQVSYPIFY